MALRISRRRLSEYYAKSLVDGMSAKKLAKELAAYLIETNRTKEAEFIARDIEFALSKEGIVIADVVSARSLSEATRKEIEKLAKSMFSAKQVELRDTIDPSVIGGVKIDFAGFQLDNTIKQKLTALRANHKV
jgi:F-type H+-transporting ATPase subunit delta